MPAALTSPPRDEILYVRTAESASLPELTRATLTAPAKASTGAIFAAGSVGTIVGVWKGGAAYEVEFPEPVGSLATVAAADLKRG